MKGWFSILNLKKISGVLLSCVMAGALFTGCVNEVSTNDPASTRIGIISKLNISEEILNNHLKKLEAVVSRPGINFSHNFHYYDSINSLLMGIQSNQIDEISTYKCVANYTIERNPDLELLNHTVNMFDSFCCAVRKDDKSLLESLDSAILSMQNDGTLENLTKTYITDLKGDTEPPAVELPKIDGADTIKVGVTGDLPPLDLILADGKPAGFNTAVLAEISKRINKNIELVQIEGNARATALVTGKIDVVFWITVPDEFWNKADDAPSDIDKPNELEVTLPYYKDEIVHIGLKK